ncbi:MAG: glycosyltransferase family 39 protein [Candidatus Komeilibacteria bacterium]|nr:glycosyltransferase family 39 protein [Candidatus Komeilibacteria bacterium]
MALAQSAVWDNAKPVLNSPDETSNLFFAKLFADHNTLKFQDPANQIANGLVTPRSMRVINGFTVPAGFLGLPLIYGTLAKLTGECAIPFFTPIIAIVGLLFFYCLIKEIFDKNTAFVAALFAFILPPFWYYATKGLMPNVAFVSFFIMALYFFIRAINGKKWWLFALAGLFAGLALMVRTSEVVWLAPLFLLLVAFNFRKVKWGYLLLSFLVFLATLAPIFYFNKQIYGSVFSVGYSLAIDLSNKDILGQSLTLAQKIFLPFGFNPQAALKNLTNYTVRIFPLWSFLIGFGWLITTLYWLTAKKLANRKVYLLYNLLFLLIGAYLVIFYGSWLFSDNPDPEAVTIGTSYIRYWLPLYLFSLPFLAYLLINAFKRFKLAGPVFIVYLWLLCGFTSYQLVMLNDQEGILAVQKNINEYQIIATEVINRTPAKAVIIADRLDKVFFPDRSVIFRLNVAADYVRINELIAGGYPVYWFNFTRTADDLAYFNKQSFEPYRLKLGNSLLSFAKQSLYPVEIIPKGFLREK